MSWFSLLHGIYQTLQEDDDDDDGLAAQWSAGIDQVQGLAGWWTLFYDTSPNTHPISLNRRCWTVPCSCKCAYLAASPTLAPTALSSLIGSDPRWQG